MSASALKIVKANYEARAGKLAELRSIDEAAEGRVYTPDEEAQVSGLRSELEAIDSRIQENLKAELRSAEIGDAMGSLLGALDRRLDGDDVDTRSIGQRFAQMEEFRAWAQGAARGTSPSLELDVELRAVTDVTTGAASGGALINNARLARLGRDFLDRRLFLMDLLPHIPVSTGSVEYVQDQSPLADLADAAREVTEGAAKPQAGPTMAVVTEPTATIAAWANMTRQVAADAPQVAGYLDNRLRYAVKRRASSQIINGNGTSPNLRGLINRSGITTAAPGAAEARYVTIRKAITALEQVEAVPEIIVLNPADAELFDLSNSTSAGIHATPDETGGLQQAGARTVWGMTPVRNTGIASGTALLIDPMAVGVLDRQQISAYMTDSHASNFTSNILTLLLEMRVGLAVFDPKAICRVTFNGTT